MTISDKNIRYAYLLLIPVIIFFHYDLIRLDTLLMRDDFMLINPIEATATFVDYWKNLFSGVYSDIQPVRDLSFYINLKIFHLFGYGGFHVMNILLGGLLLGLGRTFLKRLNFSESYIFPVIVLIACHPVFNSTLAWVSNRKHLLSFVFMMMFALEEIKSQERSWKSFLWAALSFLSQPITIFIPALVVLYKKFAYKTSIKKWDIGILVLTILIFVMNVWFYKTQTQFAGRDYITAGNSDFGIYILRLFRVSVQILFPVSIAAEYNLGNTLNFIGIFLSIIGLYLVVKFTKPKHQLFLYLIIFTTLIPAMNWGVKDGYLIPTLLLFGFLVTGKKPFYYLVIPYVLFLSFYSVKFTKMWLNDYSLMETSYETEGGAMNMSLYAHQLAKRNPAKAFEYYNEVLKAYPDMINPPLLAERAIALSKSPRSNEEKLAEFKQIQNPDIFMLFFEGRLLSQMGRNEESSKAFQNLSSTLKNPDLAQLFSYLICSEAEYKDDCNKVLGK